jgi:hypothetical protein
VIQRYEEGSDAKHKSGAGRLTQKLPPKQARRLVAESTGRVGVSHKNWPLNMEILLVMLEKPWPRMV